MQTQEHQRTNHEGCPPLAGILLAVSVALVTLGVQCIHGVPEVLQWQRHGGMEWTWITSHLSHWSWNHLAWDLFAFGLLSLLCLRLMPSRYAACLLVAAVFIPLEVQINQQHIESYRGLSGLDTALMGLLVAALWRHPTADHSCGVSQVLAVLGGGSFLAKTMYELTTGGTVFVSAGNEPFVPVISAHFVGFVCGFLVGIFKSMSRLTWNKGAMILKASLPSP